MGYTIHDFLNDNYIDDEKVCLGTNAYNISSISDVKEFTESDYLEYMPEVYMSMSTLQPYALARSKKMVKHIKFLYMDLDIWHEVNGKYEGWTASEVLELMDKQIFDQDLIPYPSSIHHTGRGFLLLWRIFKDDTCKKDVGFFDHFLWEKIQERIADVFSDFYVDASCVHDYSRVFRLLDTYNSHSGSTVKWVDGSLDGLSLKQWSKWAKIDQISDKQSSTIKNMVAAGITLPKWELKTKRQASEFISRNMDSYNKKVVKSPTEKQITYAIQLSQKYNKPLPSGFESNWIVLKQFIDSCNQHKQYADNCGSYFVCMRIIQAMIEANPDQEGRREILLWIYRICYYAMYQDDIASLDAVKNINSCFLTPLRPGEVSRATASAVKHNERYNNFVCYFLARVTGYSFDELKTKFYKRSVMTSEERKEYNANYYRNKIKSLGKYTKEEVIMDRRWNVNRLVEQGYTNVQIASELNISVRQVQRDRAAIKKGDKISNLNIICVTCPVGSEKQLTPGQLYINRKQRRIWIAHMRNRLSVASTFASIYSNLFNRLYETSLFAISSKCAISGKALRTKILDKLTICDIQHTPVDSLSATLLYWIRMIEQRYHFSVTYHFQSSIILPLESLFVSSSA